MFKSASQHFLVMKNCILYIVLVIVCASITSIEAKEAAVDSLPKVFLIGEYDKGYEKLNLSFMPSNFFIILYSKQSRT